MSKSNYKKKYLSKQDLYKSNDPEQYEVDNTTITTFPSYYVIIQIFGIFIFIVLSGIKFYYQTSNITHNINHNDVIIPSSTSRLTLSSSPKPTVRIIERETANGNGVCFAVASLQLLRYSPPIAYWFQSNQFQKFLEEIKKEDSTLGNFAEKTYHNFIQVSGEDKAYTFCQVLNTAVQKFKQEINLSDKEAEDAQLGYVEEQGYWSDIMLLDVAKLFSLMAEKIKIDGLPLYVNPHVSINKQIKDFNLDKKLNAAIFMYPFACLKPNRVVSLKELKSIIEDENLEITGIALHLEGHSTAMVRNWSKPQKCEFILWEGIFSIFLMPDGVPDGQSKERDSAHAQNVCTYEQISYYINRAKDASNRLIDEEAHQLNGVEIASVAVQKKRFQFNVNYDMEARK